MVSCSMAILQRSALSIVNDIEAQVSLYGMLILNALDLSPRYFITDSYSTLILLGGWGKDRSMCVRLVVNQ